MLARHRAASAAAAGAGIVGAALYLGLSWEGKAGDAQVRTESAYDETADTAGEARETAPRDALPVAMLWKGEEGGKRGGS